jgi:hypothetical protein
MNAVRGTGAGAWLAAVLISGCSGAAPPGSAPARLAVTDTLITGCTGGITGGGIGSAVTGAGELLRFTQAGPGPAGRSWTLVGSDSASARRIFGRLAASGFDRAEFNNPANMTCSLSRHGDHPREIAWPMGRHPRAIARIVAVSDEIVRIVDAYASH